MLASCSSPRMSRAANAAEWRECKEFTVASGGSGCSNDGWRAGRQTDRRGYLLVCPQFPARVGRWEREVCIAQYLINVASRPPASQPASKPAGSEKGGLESSGTI